MTFEEATAAPMAPPSVRAAVQREAHREVEITEVHGNNPRRRVTSGTYVHRLEQRDIPLLEELTCFKCSEYSTCAYAFDDWNTHGDCIMEK